MSSSGEIFRDLRSFISFLNSEDRLKPVRGADWDLELGGITELTWRRNRENSPALLFDEIDGYPEGFRVLTLGVATTFNYTAAVGLEPTDDRRTAVVAVKERENVDPLEPTIVDDGPVLENQIETDIDARMFPAPKYKEGEGGRFLGTGDVVITRNRDSDEYNAGTYRAQIHGPETVSFHMAPGRDGWEHMKSYHQRGEPAPIVLCAGQAPDLFLCACERFPSDVDELAAAGGRRGEPVEMVEGDVTGLPFPADAEIVLEGHIYPDTEPVVEGPFGEVFGYYAGLHPDVTPMTVEKIYHRNDPIILGVPHHRPPQDVLLDFRMAPRLWNELERSGIPGIGEVNTLPFGSGMCNVVSVDTQYPGHSTQVGMQVVSSQTAYLLGYWTIVVDEDIDVFDQDHVLWAVLTRCDPSEDLHVLDNMLSFNLDPVTHQPGQLSDDRTETAKARGDATRSRLLIDATRPHEWKDDFPESTDLHEDLKQSILDRWGDDFFNWNP